MLTSVALSFVLAQGNPVDVIVQKHLDKGLLGVGVAVVKDGKVVHLKTYGKGSTPNHDGHYRLASITKQFTAGVIVRLVREKKFAYEDTLGKLMPDTPTDWHPVTIRQLLTHTSGIPSYTNSKKFAFVMQKAVNPDGIWQLVRDEKMDFAPGTRYSYNNTAYALLGCLIERTTKKDYYSALDAYLLRPAGMRSTGSERRFKVVESFGENGKPSFQMNMDWPYSAGALVTTLADMTRWDIALRGTRLFTTAEKELMFNPDPTTVKLKEPYGFGWHPKYENGKIYSYAHEGGIPGFSTMIDRAVDGTTVIVLANHEHRSRSILSNEVIEHFYPKPIPPMTVDTMPELTAKHRQMFVNLLKGSVNESDFSDEFLKQVPVSVLISSSKQFAEMGELGDFVLIKSEGDKDVRRSYRLMLGETKMTLNIAVQGGLIVGMTIR